VETFNSADGLLTNIVNPGAALLDHRGRIWFGLPEGPAFLDPAEAMPRGELPPPVLEGFSVEGKETRPSPGLRFPHGTRRLAFRFFTPSFYREEDLRFRTQLLGLESEPGPWTFENARDYGGLRPGDYELRVWARDDEGQLSEPLRFPFQIKPSPWVHPMALVLYVLALGLGLVAIIRFRTRMLRRRNAWLQARVDEATEELSRNHQSLQVLADHLYRLNEEKSLFMGMAAHDLRNPLQGIRMKAELLALRDDPASLQTSKEICSAVDEVVRLLNRLLDLEALETGRPGSLPRQPVALAPVLDRARALHQARARAKDIDLLAEREEPAPIALADPDTLAEVVDNLLSNAIKFSPVGRRVWLGTGLRDGQPALWIRDEGPGFLPEDRARAFKRFARLSARPTGGEKSTGLGLAIVKRLVEDLGGRIELDSEPGRGATFLVRLPQA
jgi:signal transduction histidine kinase